MGSLGLRALASLALALLIAPACGPGPKPASMITFERMRKEAIVPSMKKHAGRHWKDSENYYRLAYEAWDDGEDEEAREYTLLGVMLYRTAEAAVKSAEIEAEVEALDRRVAKARKRTAKAANAKLAMEQAVGALQGQLAMSNKLAALESKRRTEMAAMQEQMAGEQALADARKRHGDLLLKLKESEAVEAQKYAAGEYNKAKNLLDKAAIEIEGGKAREARGSLSAATTQIFAAIEAARPRFVKVQAKKARDEMNQRLVAMAHTVGASDVRVEPRGVVMVVHKLFKGKSTRLSAKSQLRLDRVGTLINEFPTYKILVEGHTNDRGKDEANLTRSQAWANSVLGHYVSKGVSPDRIQSVGYGEGAPLVENRGKSNRAKNRRVEVVMLFAR
jgi:outer membrane protein OmpA-like peptidoglycan-associated protein